MSQAASDNTFLVKYANIVGYRNVYYAGPRACAGYDLLILTKNELSPAGTFVACRQWPSSSSVCPAEQLLRGSCGECVGGGSGGVGGNSGFCPIKTLACNIKPLKNKVNDKENIYLS